MFVLANVDGDDVLQTHPSFDHHKLATQLRAAGKDVHWWFAKANRMELRAGLEPSRAWLLLSGRTVGGLIADGGATNRIYATDRFTGAEFVTNWRFVQSQAIDPGFSNDVDGVYLCEFEDIRSVWLQQTPNEYDQDDSDPDTQPYDYNVPIQFHNPSGADGEDSFAYFTRTVSDPEAETPWSWSEVFGKLWAFNADVDLVASPVEYGFNSGDITALCPDYAPVSVRSSIDSRSAFATLYRILLDLGLELYPNPKGAPASPITDTKEYFNIKSIADVTYGPRYFNFVSATPATQRTIRQTYQLIAQDLQENNAHDVPAEIVVHFPALRYHHNTATETRTNDFPSAHDIHEHEPAYQVTVDVTALPSYGASGLLVKDGFKVHKYINHVWAQFSHADNNEPFNQDDLEDVAEMVADRLVTSLALPGDVRSYDGIHEFFPSPSYPLVVMQDGGSGGPTATTLYGANSQHVRVYDRLYTDPVANFFPQRKAELRPYYKTFLGVVTEEDGIAAGVSGEVTIQQYLKDDPADIPTITRNNRPQTAQVFNMTGATLAQDTEVVVRYDYGVGEWVVEAASQTAVYKLTNCEDETDVLYVCNNLSDDLNKVVVVEDTLELFKCYYVENATCPGCKDGCVEIVARSDTCIECLGCYALIDCDEMAATPVFYSRTKILAAYVGTIVDISAGVDGFPPLPYFEGRCFTVVRLNSLASCADPINVDPYLVSTSLNCDVCDACYEIERCGTDVPEYVAVGFESNFPPHLGTISVPDDLIGFVFKWKGECYEVTDHHTTCPEAKVSVTPKPTSQEWYANCDNCGCYRLTPCEGQTGDPEILYVRHVVDENDEIFDLSDYTGDCDALRIQLDEDTAYCYTVESVTTGCAGVTSDEYIVLETYPCAGFGPHKGGCLGCLTYQLERCDDDEITICTPTDFSQWLNFIDDDPESGLDTTTIPPHVFKREEDGFCYKLVAVVAWTDACVPFTIIGEFGEEETACDLCMAEKVKLVANCGCEDPCDGGANPITFTPPADIYSDDADLLAAVGKWVKIEGRCYQIQATDDADSPEEIDCWTGPYETCDECKAAPSTITLSYLRFVAGSLVAENITLVGPFNVCNRASIATEEC
jgi:hypothetical protein